MPGLGRVAVGSKVAGPYHGGSQPLRGLLRVSPFLPLQSLPPPSLSDDLVFHLLPPVGLFPDLIRECTHPQLCDLAKGCRKLAPTLGESIATHSSGVLLSMISAHMRLRIVKGVFESTLWKLYRWTQTGFLASRTRSHHSGCGCDCRPPVWYDRRFFCVAGRQSSLRHVGAEALTLRRKFLGSVPFYFSCTQSPFSLKPIWAMLSLRVNLESNGEFDGSHQPGGPERTHPYLPSA